MAKKLYSDANYLIADYDNGTVERYPKKFTVIEKETDTVSIKNTIEDFSVGISDADAGSWLDAEDAGSPYTPASLLTFLLANTGNFSLASGSGAQIGDLATWDGEKYAPLAPSGSANTWDVGLTAVVNRITGNDLTAVAGDGNKPFATIAAAQDAAQFVILMPSNYVETVILKSNTQYYAHAGVKFTAGGLRVPATGITRTKWLGNADFVGNFFAIYLNGGQYTDLTIEFNRMITTGGSSRSLYISPASASNITVRGLSIDAYGANAHGVNIQGSISGTVTIDEYVTCAYSTVRLGFSGSPLIGKLVFNCPRIVLKSGGFAGTLAQYKQAVYVIDGDPATDITVNGDIYINQNSTLGSVSGALADLGGAVAGGSVKFNGNIYAAFLRAIRHVDNFNLTVKGDIKSENRAFVTGGSAWLHVKGSTIKQSAANQITGSSTVYLSESSIYSDGNNLNIIDHTTLASSLFTDNVTAEATGAAEFINTGGVASQAGLKNTAANVSNDPALINVYGITMPFIQDPNINVPKNN